MTDRCIKVSISSKQIDTSGLKTTTTNASDTRKRWSRIWPQRGFIRGKSERGLACVYEYHKRASERAKISRFSAHGASRMRLYLQHDAHAAVKSREWEKTRARRGKKRETKQTSASGWRARFRESWTSVQGIEGSTASWYIYRVCRVKRDTSEVRDEFAD